MAMDPRFISQRSLEYGLHSCDYCQTLIIDLRNASTRPERVNLDTIRLGGPWIFEAIEKGCSFFQFCVQTVKVPASKSDALAYSTTVATVDMADQLTLIVKIHQQLNEEGLVLGCTVAWERADEHPSLSQLSPFWQFQKSLRSLIFDLLPAKDLSTQIDQVSFANHAVSSHINSETTFSLSRGWLSECLRSHPECRNVTQMSPPVRLIDVGSEKDLGRVKLVSAGSLTDPTWATLSYCWGGEQKAQTTRHNVHERYASIQLSRLPTTLQDAVSVCRRINIPFLWVDSICIIQDDEHDKGQEISKMAEIYQGSIVTLSASCASSCHEGFLQDRVPYAPGAALPLRYDERGYDILQVINTAHAIRNEPINARAWTFQERLLSKRILDYGTNQVKWLCHRVERSTIKLPPPQDTLASFFPQENELSWSEIREKWTTLVEAYSPRSLTFPQDKLVALAAVARRFAERCNFQPSDYIAGLWESTIVQDLLWYSSDPEATMKLASAIAPSWSWASIVGEVQWGSDSWMLEPILLTGEVLRTSIQYANGAVPFAAVKGGQLYLRGPSTQAVLDPSESTIIDFAHPSSIPTHRLTLKPDQKNFGEVKGLAPKITVLFMELTSRIHTEGRFESAIYTGERRGLLLRPTENSNEFHRIGLYEQSVPLKGGLETFPGSCEQCMRNVRASNMEIQLV